MINIWHMHYCWITCIWIVLSYDSFNISPPGKWKLFIRRRSCSIFADHEAILSISHVEQLIVRSESVHYDFGGLRLICRWHAVTHPRPRTSCCSSCWCERWLVRRFCWSARWLVEALWRVLEGLWRRLLICVSPPEGECSKHVTMTIWGRMGSLEIVFQNNVLYINQTRFFTDLHQNPH